MASNPITLISALDATQAILPQINQTQSDSKPESDMNKKLDEVVTEMNKVDPTTSDKTPALAPTDEDQPLFSGELDSDSVDPQEFKLKELDEEDDLQSVATNNLEAAHDKQTSMKYRRQVVPDADWWTKLSHNSKTSSKSDDKKLATKTKKTTPKKTSLTPKSKSTTNNVYKEQPLSQNAILTIKNQLAAIRSKHRVLVTRSIYQLYQLDNKLIDSYKLCLKKKMPLYAGMLYRTRDFVIRMGKEVNHERKVLEAMTKQVQSVLKQKMSNRTLVREYNQLVATSTEKPERYTESRQTLQISSIDQNLKIVSTKLVAERVKKDSPAHRTDTKQADREQSEISQVDLISTTLPSTGSRGVYASEKLVHFSKESSSISFHKSITNDLETHGESKKVKCQDELSQLKKPKSTRYTVHINEVNLKKELNKAQALINRINGSSYELNSVVDDIVFLYKLNDVANRKGSKSGTKSDKTNPQQIMDSMGSASDLKRARKMLKSPSRILLEKYGKMSLDEGTITSGPMPGSPNASSYPDFKPIFNSSSFALPEMSDQDPGFDYSAPLGGRVEE